MRDRDNYRHCEFERPPTQSDANVFLTVCVKSAITTAAQQLDVNNKQKSFVVDVKAMLLSSVAKSLTPLTTRSKLIVCAW
jgi:hypothetical protein